MDSYGIQDNGTMRNLAGKFHPSEKFHVESHENDRLYSKFGSFYAKLDYLSYKMTENFV